MVNVLKFPTLFFFLFSNKMLVIKAGTHKMVVKIVNREDPDQTASSEVCFLGMPCLSRLFWQAASVQNFRTFTVHSEFH